MNQKEEYEFWRNHWFDETQIEWLYINMEKDVWPFVEKILLSINTSGTEDTYRKGAEITEISKDTDLSMLNPDKFQVIFGLNKSPVFKITSNDYIQYLHDFICFDIVKMVTKAGVVLEGDDIIRFFDRTFNRLVWEDDSKKAWAAWNKNA